MRLLKPFFLPLSCFLGLLLVSSAFADAPVGDPTVANPWDLSLESNLNVNQSSYTANWDGSEKGSYTWSALVNGRAQRQLTWLLNSRTNLRLEYGQSHTQDNASRKWAEPVSSTDRIDIESILRFTLGGPVDPFLSGRFQSQFLDARDPEADYYINPMRFTESIGIARPLVKTPTQELLTRIGFAMREKLDQNALIDSINQLHGHDWTYDGGIEFVADFKTPLFKKKVTYTGRLSLYQALFNSENDKLAGSGHQMDWKALDAELESTFTAAVAGMLNVNLDIRWLYDKEIARGGRFKQALALGLAYTFI